jgi:hypothetical protein
LKILKKDEKFVKRGENPYLETIVKIYLTRLRDQKKKIIVKIMKIFQES